MKSFLTLLWSSIKMLVRNRGLLISSLGLAVISMLIFGWLFGSNRSPTLSLGVVDEDTSTSASQIVSQLKQSKSLVISTGSQADEVQALREGNRDAVIVLPAGFGADLAAGHADIAVYYDQSNPVTQSTARMTVESVVASFNQQVSGQAPPIALQEQAVSVRELRQIDWLTPGMLGLLLLWGNLTVGIVLAEWRKTGVMKRLAATPLRPGTLVGTQMLARLLLSLVQCAILLALALVIFNVQVIGNWGLLVLTIAIGALTLMAIGFIAGSFARSPEAANAVTLLVTFPMMFLGGTYFPTTGAPDFLKPVIQVLPLSYLNDALRQVMNDGATLAAISTDLLVLLAWMAAALLLANRAFRWAV
jgi:ABC-2 type transport system permease protein